MTHDHGNKRYAQRGSVFVTDMIDGKRSEAIQAGKARDASPRKGAIEVERQVLNLCALAQKMNQPVGDAATGTR